MEDFKNALRLRTQEAEEIVQSFLPNPGQFDSEVITAMNYSVEAGGKRLRPVFIKSFYTLFGGKGELPNAYMAALEMLHTYSLVHDDLPAIDNDELRRGRATTHKQFGEACAILAGDALLHESYEVIVRELSHSPESEIDLRVKALAIFGQKSGLHGMLGGQSADVIHTGEVMSDELLTYVYENKTGALLEGAMMIGAALAGASDQDIRTVEHIGSLVGLAFQIRDDVLDLTGDETTLGKPILSDEKNQKKTYVTVHGLKESQEDLERMTKEAVSLLDSIGMNENEREFLKALTEYLTKRVS